MRKIACLVVSCAAFGCSSTPPANWQTGGARIFIPEARWQVLDYVVDIERDGTVLINGDHEMSIDTAGRVFDEDGESVALLETDGSVSGNDGDFLGMVGSDHASLPDRDTAWLSMAPSGEVIRYGEDGTRYAFGVWVGCRVHPTTSQACLLVSHLLAKRIGSRAHSGFSVGIGVGVPIR